MKKATDASQVVALEQIPNIGPSIAQDLRDIGIHAPDALRGANAETIYEALCIMRGIRQDPCVLDTFMAAIDFMSGAPPTPWWHYTTLRKQSKVC
jgi:Pathogenicity locus